MHLHLHFLSIALFATRVYAVAINFDVTTPAGSRSASSDPTPKVTGHISHNGNNYWDFPLHLEIHFSDSLVKVGNLDLFKATWEAFYEQSDETGVDFDHNRRAFPPGCFTESFDDRDSGGLHTTTTVTGTWGTIDPLSGWDVRNVLIQALWRALPVLRQTDEDFDGGDGNVMTGCKGLTWMDAIYRDPSAACGIATPRECQCPSKRGYMKTLQCDKIQPSYAVPSRITVSVFDASLRPLDASLQVAFASEEEKHPGCNKFGAIEEVMASFLPEFGKIIESAIKIYCRPNL